MKRLNSLSMAEIAESGQRIERYVSVTNAFARARDH
jgi:hypothetical protein